MPAPKQQYVAGKSLENDARIGCEEQKGLQKVHYRTGLSSLRLPCKDSTVLSFSPGLGIASSSKALLFITHTCSVAMGHLHRDKRKKENSTGNTDIQK